MSRSSATRSVRPAAGPTRRRSRELIESVGSDLRELAAAAAQLVADTNGQVTVEAIRRYHRGRADVTGFAVAEKAVTGDVTGALEMLRWAMQLGVPHVLVADALADAVRTVAKVAGAGRADPFQLSSELGMPAWKVRKALSQSRGWHPAGLVAAMQVVAEVNADVKGVAVGRGICAGTSGPAPGGGPPPDLTHAGRIGRPTPGRSCVLNAAAS